MFPPVWSPLAAIKGSIHACPPGPSTQAARSIHPLYSAAEEGGSVSSLHGCIIHTPGAHLAYKVLLIHRGRPDSEHSFATMPEAEAFIRGRTPVPAPPPL